MATNKYFNNIYASNEQNLTEDLTIESIKIKGMDLYYIPRTLVAENKILGEDAISSFTDQRPIEMYLQNVNGFEGGGDLLSKFGLQIKDSATFIVAKRRFERETSMVRPKEGDLLYFPLTKGLFEIKFVEHENPFYAHGKNYSFSLSVQLFQFSEETVSTGESVIDDIVESIRFLNYLTLTGANGSFTADSLVYQYGSGATSGATANSIASGNVVSYSNNLLTISRPVGLWQESSANSPMYVVNANNTTYGQVVSISDSLDDSEYNDNEIIENLKTTTLDTSIPNPFGNP
jgi:hypothetical protein